MGYIHKDNWKRVTGVRVTRPKDPTDLMWVEDLVAGSGITIDILPNGGIRFSASGTGGGGGGGGAASGTIALSPSGVSGPSGTITNDASLVIVEESGAMTLTLAEPMDEGRQITIKDGFIGTTDRGVNTITIVPESGLIDGQANAEIVNQYQSYTVVKYNGNWFII